MSHLSLGAVLEILVEEHKDARMSPGLPRLLDVHPDVAVEEPVELLPVRARRF